MDKARIRGLLSHIYGEGQADDLFERLLIVLARYRPQFSKLQATDISERDAILITYPDQVLESGRPSLISLTEFCNQYLTGLFSRIHVLPFFPWSSDDGFSVIDYKAVASQYGTWGHIQSLGSHFQLMFDAVINHISSHSSWFEGFLDGKQPYVDYFIEVSGDPNLSQVVRPRALPLLTRFNTSTGQKAVWTTFSNDQIDLNYHDPNVLLEIVDVLLFYVSQGAEFIRLDAIAYLWKEIATSCIHLPKTHAIVQLFRAILDEMSPNVKLVTETNVAHTENIAYFGNGFDEAKLIYNFALPPLVLHTFQSSNAAALSKWASGIKLPSKKTTFLNFLASHDGIGLNAAQGLLSDSEIEDLVRRTESRGGLISKKTNSDGKQSPYELNENYFDALDNPDATETIDSKVDRFLTAHAILLEFIGVPAIYFHSMFGSRGWPDGATESGQNRSINRQKLERGKLQSELADDNSLRARVYIGLSHLLQLRVAEPAFSPAASQQVLDCGNHVFAVVRMAFGNPIMCLSNVSAEPQDINLDSTEIPFASTRRCYDLISGNIIEFAESLTISLKPYQTYWLKN